MSAEITSQEEKYRLLAERTLKGKTDLEKQLAEVKKAHGDIEKMLQELQIQSGELSAKLEQAKQERASLKSSRHDQKELRAEESLYSKLRRAFSKNGIPSLIIEQSLPEIEERDQ